MSHFKDTLSLSSSSPTPTPPSSPGSCPSLYGQGCKAPALATQPPPAAQGELLMLLSAAGGLSGPWLALRWV